MTDHLTPPTPARPLRPAKPALQGQHQLSKGLCLGLALLMVLPTAGAQNGRLNTAPAVSPRIPAARNLSTELQLKGVQSTADYIVAVVNQEIITHQDVDKRVRRIIETARPGTQLPSGEALRQQVLDALVDEKVQLSYAKSMGMEVSEADLDTAVETIAAQNQITLAELKERMRVDGLDYQRYRASLREQIMLERIRSREVNPRIQISDADIDAFYAEGAKGLGETSYNIAHILIRVPDNATPELVKVLQAKAQDLQQRASRGENFAALAKANSADTNTRDTGGSFGMRDGRRLPELFTDAVKDLAVGKVAPVVRSGAGFHVVKLIERENAAKATYTQQRARHILIRTTPKLDTQTALARMQDIRRQLLGGQASFAQLARQFSDDGSATHGGDLGWAAPGQFVPEFEKALLALQPGQISEPVVTRFGVHLIQLVERREIELTEQQKREAARSVLREQRFEAAYEDWARELRAAAWVEMRDAP
ncbi:MAG: peptidylprolyl isomerase [Burkholderiales bacterium]|nr:peptidylprolyl isomerase [Burkholderiales bacterium]